MRVTSDPCDYFRKDTMSEQEKIDLEKMKEEIVKTKISSFELSSTFIRMVKSDLPHTGYKTVEEAVFSTIKRGQQKIDDLTRAHTRKYPD